MERTGRNRCRMRTVRRLSLALMAVALLGLACGRGLRFRKAVSYGNAIDLNAIDFLQDAVSDEDTKVILLYQVEIDTGRQRAPVVPASAIIAKDGGRGVLVAANGVLHFREVVLGLQDGAKSAVTKGLKAGELVVVKPAGLKPGMKIRPVIKPAAPRT